MLSGPCLETTFSHILANSPLSADEDHGAGRRYETGLIDVVPLFFFHDNRADIGDQIVVGRPFAEQRPQIVIFLAEQTGAKLAIRSQPDAGAMAAKGLRYRGNEANFARGAIREAVFAGCFATLMGYLLERPTGLNALVDFGGGYDQVAGPVAVGIKRHEFDNAHDDAGFAGEQSEGFDFVVVDAAYQNGVHLGGGQARFLRDVNAVHHGRKRLGSGDTLEFPRIQGIEADVDTAEAGSQ